VQVVDLVQTLDGGRRNMYDPDEIEEEQREREKRNKINADFKQFTARVQVRPWSCCAIGQCCAAQLLLLSAAIHSPRAGVTTLPLKNVNQPGCSPETLP
jgi:hypothetical protein